MSEKRSRTLHFGGPLGLAGLGLLASAAGIVVYSSTTEPVEPAQPVVGVPSAAPDNASVATGGEDSDAERLTQGSETIDSAQETARTEEPAAPEASATERSVPATIPASRPKDVAMRPAAKTGTEMTFIVRIKGSPDIDEAAKLYRRDYDAAQSAFAAYQKTTPAMEDFRLVGASYSGEIKLAYELPADREPTRAVVREVQDRLLAVDGVAYADPDYIAHPGKRD